jgi:hypothetical protein
MSLLERLFSKSVPKESLPAIRFGRFSDAFRSEAQYDAWDQATSAYDAEDYLKSFQLFLDYLYNEAEDNVHYQRLEDGRRIEFELYQGSKRITGEADAAHIRVEARIARVKELHIGYLRRLVEQNFDLKYARYALSEDQHLCLVFDTLALDSSPYKLYYAFKELAVHADKQDDLLLDEFESLEPVDNQHIIPISEEVKEVKYQYILQSIQNGLQYLDSDASPRETEFSGGVAYLLLDLCYRLDFLISPEGYMTECLERIHRQYFAEDEQSNAQKIQLIKREFHKLTERSREDFFKEFYEVRLSFGITNPVSHAKLQEFIDAELYHMDWYLEQGYEQVALAIPGYILGYSLFNYGLQAPIRDLIFLYYRLVEPDYFRGLGFPQDEPLIENGRYHKRHIQRALRRIEQRYRGAFPNLYLSGRHLDYETKAGFVRSYLGLIRDLDLNKL